MSKPQISLRRGVLYLLAFGLLNFCGCKTLKSVANTSAAIDKNRTAIEQSTDVINRNAKTISDSTGMIESNKLVIEGSTEAIAKNQVTVEQSTAAIAKNAETLNEIVAATDKLKAHQSVVTFIFVAVALLLIVPSVLALLVLWRMNKLMRIWLRKEEKIKK